MQGWFDLEFNEQPGETISLGIVTEQGHEFYEVLRLRDNPTRWVAANVMPVRNKTPVSLGILQERLLEFLSRYDELELRCDHPADAERFMRLLQVGDTGAWLKVRPTLTVRLLVGLPGTSEHSAVPHNALEDALALRRLDLNRAAK